MMFVSENTIRSRVFAVLQDQEWHCREHDFRDIPSRQLAGGGGIQGLQRGTRSRPGIEIESKDEFCAQCNKITRWDRWTGKLRAANAPTPISSDLVERILEHYKFTDIIEMRQRPRHELVIDHRFPMERWGEVEPPHPRNMSQEQIEAKFQLLKADAVGNHNLLKSRACETCIKTRKRGHPFGIAFFYEGDEEFPIYLPERGAEAEKGCHGCGWYDFAKWRKALNQALEQNRSRQS